MATRHGTSKGDKKIFSATSKKTKSLNSNPRPMRGGIRL